MKSNRNGITLIALIITIIVMLILVAVTISISLNGGLFAYAKKAVKDTNKAKQAEEELDKLQPGLSVDQLIEKFTDGKNSQSSGKLSEVAKSGDTVAYNAGSGVFNWKDKEGNTYNSTNFASDESNTQNNFTASDYNDGWRVLRVDSDGYVYLISEKSVASLYLYGENAFFNINGENNIFSIIASKYVNPEFADTASILNLSDLKSINEEIGNGSNLNNYINFEITNCWIDYSYRLDYVASVHYIAEYIGSIENGIVSSPNYVHYDAQKSNDKFVYVNGGAPNKPQEFGYTLGLHPVIKLKQDIQTSGKNENGEWVLVPMQ